MCCTTATWKREVVPDHKFDFVDTREFADNGCGMRTKYLWLYVIILKSFLVYLSDIFTAVTMLTTQSWSNAIFASCPPNHTNGCVYIPFEIGRWLFFGCVVFGFLLLAYESHKSKKIIASRDISYAFTNVMANNYYSLRSYDHFCFFDHISNSTKRMDDYAFFVFFTFKSWKRLLLADGPRQAINALTLYGFYLSKENKGPWYQISKYFDGNDFATTALTISTAFTCLVFIGSLLLLIVAGIGYFPLLMHIQGNLKEYCCHKVDKRIAEIIKRRNKKRFAEAVAQAKKEAAGDFSHLKKNKKGEVVEPLRVPTLPNVSVDDDFDDTSSMRTRGPPPSTYTAQSDYYYDRKAPEYAASYAADYPPMPAYNDPYPHHADAYHQYNPSMGALPDEQMAYDDDYGSTAHLALAASPYGNDHDMANPSSLSYGQHAGYNTDPGAYQEARGDYPSYPPADRAYDHHGHPQADHYQQQHPSNQYGYHPDTQRGSAGSDGYDAGAGLAM